MFVTDTKMIVSGDVVEIIQYEKCFKIGGSSTNSKGRSGRSCDDRTEEEKEADRNEIRSRTLSSTKQNLRRLINANADEFTKFLTLTFAENVSDLDYCNKQFYLFIKRLTYNLKKNYSKDLKYVMVVEFQKRGAVHYHILCNLPYMPSKKIEELWGNGFVKINKIDSVTNLGAYVTKYMQKDLADDRLLGRRCWNSSRNLQRPRHIAKEKEIEEIARSLSLSEIKPFEGAFHNEHLGWIYYRQYNTKNRVGSSEQGGGVRPACEE